MNIGLWIAIGVFFLSCMVGVFISMRRRKWYKVYLANNDIHLMYRAWQERWWSNDKYIRFKDDNGREFTFPGEGHWLLMWERIPDGEVEVVRTEIAIMKKVKQENNA